MPRSPFGPALRLTYPHRVIRQIKRDSATCTDRSPETLPGPLRPDNQLGDTRCWKITISPAHHNYGIAITGNPIILRHSRNGQIVGTS
jgi:hypothetical protein